MPKFKQIPEDRKAFFSPLQEWEGYVLEVYNDYFTARLVDITAGDSQETEGGEFPIGDVDDKDLSLLKSGAVFRWLIGYEKSYRGTKKRISQVVFRRLPQWTKTDIDEAKNEARRISKKIHWK